MKSQLVFTQVVGPNSSKVWLQMSLCSCPGGCALPPMAAQLLLAHSCRTLNKTNMCETPSTRGELCLKIKEEEEEEEEEEGEGEGEGEEGGGGGGGGGGGAGVGGAERVEAGVGVEEGEGAEAGGRAGAGRRRE